MELDITKSKKLIFSINIANVDITSVKGTFVLFLNSSFNIGISTIIENGKLAVNIPPLEKFDFEKEKEYQAELWIVANRDYYTIPWNKKILIKNYISTPTTPAIVR